MAKPKRSSDEYIHLNKKVTDKDHIKLINLMADETGVTPTQAAYNFLCVSLKKELEKRKLSPK